MREAHIDALIDALIVRYRDQVQQISPTAELGERPSSFDGHRKTKAVNRPIRRNGILEEPVASISYNWRAVSRNSHRRPSLIGSRCGDINLGARKECADGILATH